MMRGFGGLNGGSQCVILGILLGLFALAEGYVHFVGGRDGWVMNPFESYNHWTGSTRFHVNDTLVFSYKKDDSVLVVNETDYNTCNPNNPIQALHGGYSVIDLDRPGPFYFISGTADQCYKGHKMVLVVMSIRSNIPVTPAASPFPSISLPPTGSALPPLGQALAPSPSLASALPPVPGADVGVGMAPEPVSGGPSAGMVPALGPSSSATGIAPAAGPDVPGMGTTPASAPNEPAQGDVSLAISSDMNWILLVFGFLILLVGLN